MLNDFNSDVFEATLQRNMANLSRQNFLFQQANFDYFPRQSKISVKEPERCSQNSWELLADTQIYEARSKTNLRANSLANQHRDTVDNGSQLKDLLPSARTEQYMKIEREIQNLQKSRSDIINNIPKVVRHRHLRRSVNRLTWQEMYLLERADQIREMRKKKNAFYVNNFSNNPIERSYECHVCQQKTKSICSLCQKKWYCSKICQTQDWPSHKYECLSYS